jgi:D-alanine-D-alanine ligase
MKKNIALVAGGYSGEYVISIQSAATIERHLDKAKYQVYKISIKEDGWFYTDPRGAHIAVDKTDFSLSVDGRHITFDAVFIGIHGTPGEDGKLQGYFDMLKIPYSGCGSITSALTFNKGYCNKVVSALHLVEVARSVHLFEDQAFSEDVLAGALRFPVFVKPAEGGSSLGVSKVAAPSEALGEAISRAFQESGQVLVEECIQGRELTCGLFRAQGKLITLPVTEIISGKDFFDFEAKYTPGVSREVTPAQVEEKDRELVQKTAEKLYCALNCRGIVRMDFILEEATGKLFFLEVNTMPGQSENSIVPQQVTAAGLSLTDFYGMLIEDCLR